MIEPLEPRVAPATLVNPTTVTYQDLDGDFITVKVSKPVFTDANISSLFHFDSTFSTSAPQLLEILDFAGLPTSANGLGLTVTAKRVPTAAFGNGAVYIGELNGSNVSSFDGGGPGIDLGKVSIQGELGRFDAGDSDGATPALISLTAHAINISDDVVRSDVWGTIGALTIRGNMSGFLFVKGGPANTPGIGKVTIGGSLLAAAGTSGGYLEAAKGYGSILIKGNIVGGAGANSGFIFSPEGGIKSLTVGGSIIGGAGPQSGGLQVDRIGSLKLGGSLIGSAADEAGCILSIHDIDKATIGGSLIAGQGTISGRITAGGYGVTLGNIGTLLIKGSITGVENESGFSAFTAGIYTTGSIQSLTVLGDLSRGNIVAGVNPGMNFRYGDNDDQDLTSGAPQTATITKLVIKGSVHGTTATTDNFGIVANAIVSAQISGATYKASNPALNFNAGIPLAFTNDVILRQVN